MSKKLKVNDQKLNIAMHDGLYAMKKFERCMRDIDRALIILARTVEQLRKNVPTDWYLNKQHILDSIITNGKLKKKVKRIRGEK